MYTVKFYKGDYYDRQMEANQDGAVAYVEHHFNSSSSTTASYAVVVTGFNASQTSKNWGRWYAKAVAAHFGTNVSGDDGILVGGWNGRGDANLRETDMPALLLEPLFASNSMQADIIRSENGQSALARILVESIQRFFPGGGRIAFSVGHKYKETNPNDLGAPLAGGGWEADYAEKVLDKAKTMLESITERPAGRKLRVMRGDDVLFEVSIDEDDVIRWAPERDLVIIPD
jgi:hypothetical protein